MLQEHVNVDKLSAAQKRETQNKEAKDNGKDGKEGTAGEENIEILGEKVSTLWVDRGPKSSVHTDIEKLQFTVSESGVSYKINVKM